MNNPWGNMTTNTQARSTEVDAGLRSFMLQVYNYMASALILTGLVAYFASVTPAIYTALYQVSPEGYMTGMTGLGWIVAFAPLAFILFLGFKVQNMSFQGAQMAFWGFAAVMGLSLTSLFLVYTGASIARVFFITSAMFGAMSLYGYTTKKDLSGWGSFLMMGVIGIIIASIVNIFLGSSMLHFAVSVIGVLIFTGLTAYDTQKLKTIYYQLQGTGETLAKAGIMGALNLYLDFINLFIMLMRLMGERR